jgi:hypothetical protein
MPDSTPARYCDYYGMLSYKEFLKREAEGTLGEPGDITARTPESYPE